jgi:hypothetical protein
LVSALVGYGLLAFRRQPGMMAMTMGVGLTVIAAVVQATEIISFVPGYPFDHNAVYHIIQIVGVYFLATGVINSLVKNGAVEVERR